MSTKKPWTRRTPEFWAAQDWAQSDYTIARSANVSAGQVWAARKRYRYPQAVHLRTKGVDWPNMDWSLTNAEIARRYGITGQTAYQQRKRYGHVSPRPKNARGFKNLRHKLTNLPRKPRQLRAILCDASLWAIIDWRNTNAEIARVLRVSPKTVRKYRPKPAQP